MQVRAIKNIWKIFVIIRVQIHGLSANTKEGLKTKSYDQDYFYLLTKKAETINGDWGNQLEAFMRC